MVTLIVLLAIYFIPAFVACRRKHRQRLAIVWLNILAGWTVLGWVGGIVWACTTDVEPQLPPPPPLPRVTPPPHFTETEMLGDHHARVRAIRRP
jgi:hypothetical protein